MEPERKIAEGKYYFMTIVDVYKSLADYKSTNLANSTDQWQEIYQIRAQKFKKTNPGYKFLLSL
jgi:hypothetical protein